MKWAAPSAISPEHFRVVDLPAGLSTRPLQPRRRPAVFEVMAAQEAADLGEVLIEEADIVSDWSRRVVRRRRLHGRRLRRRPAGRLRRGRAVRPLRRRRPPGRTAAAASAPRSRAGCRTPPARRGSPEIGMPVPQGSPGDRLLEALGYRVRWNSWGLALLEGATVPSARPARGVRRPRGRPVGVRAGLDTSRRTPSSSGRSATASRSRTGRPRSPAGPASSRGTCGSSSTRPVRSSRWPGCSSGGEETAFIARLATSEDGARPRPGPGAARRLLRGRPRARRRTGPSSRPTPAPARWRSTRRSAWSSRRPGSTAAIDHPADAMTSPPGSPAAR